MVKVLSTVTVLPEHLGSKVNIPNFILLQSLEPFEKFGVGDGGGGCVQIHFSDQP